MSRKKILLPLPKRHTHRQALALGRSQAQKRSQKCGRCLIPKYHNLWGFQSRCCERRRRQVTASCWMPLGSVRCVRWRYRMATFVILSRISPEGLDDPKDFKDLAKNVSE